MSIGLQRKIEIDVTSLFFRILSFMTTCDVKKTRECTPPIEEIILYHAVHFLTMHIKNNW